jgi:O-antigen/teichoic acid export membrane protein
VNTFDIDQPLFAIDFSPGKRLAKRTFRNSFANLAALLWPLLLFFFSIPYMIRKLGLEGYGLWLLIFSVVSTMGLFNSGLVDATIKYVSEFHARADRERTNGIVGTSTSACLLLGAAVLAASLVICPSASSFLKTKCDPGTVKFVFLTCAAGFACNMLLQNLLSVLKGLQRYDVSTRITIFTETTKVAGIVAVLYLGFGLRAVSLAYVTGMGVGVLTSWVAIKRAEPWIRLRPVMDGSFARLIVGFGSYSLLLGVSNIGRANLGNILVAAFSSAAEVPYFAIPYQAAGQVMNVVASLTSVSFPVFSSLQAVGDSKTLEKVFVSVSKYSSLLGVAIGITMFVFSFELLRLWMGLAFALAANQTFRVLILASTSVVAAAGAHFYLNGLGKVRLTAALSLATLLLIGVLGLILVPRYGVLGGAYSYLGNLILLHQIYYAASHIWGRGWLVKTFYLFGPILLSAVCVTVAFGWWLRAPLHGWYSMLSYPAIMVVCFLGSAFLLDIRFYLPQIKDLLKGHANAKLG